MFVDVTEPSWNPDIILKFFACRTHWDPLGLSGTFWDPVGPVGTFWDLSRPSSTCWDPLGSAGTCRDPVGPVGTQWDLFCIHVLTCWPKSFDFALIDLCLFVCVHQLFIMLGNDRSNDFWASRLSVSEELDCDSSPEQRRDFITQKYREGRWRLSHPAFSSQEELLKVRTFCWLKTSTLTSDH